MGGWVRGSAEKVVNHHGGREYVLCGNICFIFMQQLEGRKPLKFEDVLLMEFVYLVLFAYMPAAGCWW